MSDKDRKSAGVAASGKEHAAPKQEKSAAVADQPKQGVVEATGMGVSAGYTADEIQKAMSEAFLKAQQEDLPPEEQRERALEARAKLKAAGREALNEISQQVSQEGSLAPEEVRRRVNNLRAEKLAR